MPRLRTLMNVALGYGARAEQRQGPRYRQPDVTLAYGPHPLQALDLHLHPDRSTRPLLAFVHGGAWQFGDKARRLKDRKAPFAHQQGWHFASLNFRLVPEVGVAQMARDVAAAVALLVHRADALALDPARIVLMGHSSGAHLVALVAADPALLGAHGLAPRQLAGVIANDGAAYDPALPSTGSRLIARRLIDPAFAGRDCAALSAVRHLQQAGACPPLFLILSTSAPHAAAQAHRLAAALRAAQADGAARVELHGFPGGGIAGHVRLSRQFGRPGHAPTEVARAWLGRIADNSPAGSPVG